MLNQLATVFASLNSHQVKYVTIGGVAAILHGVPRATFDLDILIEATPENAQRLLNALVDAKLGTASLITPEELLQQNITVFKDWVRIDVQIKTPGLEFDHAWHERQTMKYKGNEFFIVSRDDLIASKRAAGRTIDLSDVNALERGSESAT